MHGGETIVRNNGSVSFPDTTVGIPVTVSFRVCRYMYVSLLTDMLTQVIVQIENRGGADLVVSNLDVPSMFEVSAPFSSIVISPAQFTTFSVRFLAERVGSFSGNVVFSTNEQTSFFVFEVTARAVPVITPSPTPTATPVPTPTKVPTPTPTQSLLSSSTHTSESPTTEVTINGMPVTVTIGVGAALLVSVLITALVLSMYMIVKYLKRYRNSAHLCDECTVNSLTSGNGAVLTQSYRTKWTSCSLPTASHSYLLFNVCRRFSWCKD